MKRKLLFWVLAAEAAVCILLSILKTSVGGVFSAAAALPFEQIGLGLRALSLAGSVGNAAAIALYAAVCLLPAAALLLIRRKRRLRGEDWLLPVLSAVLFPALYLMINPGILSKLFYSAAMGRGILGITVYSVLCAYLVLYVLRLFYAGSMERLQKYMAALLMLLSAGFVYLIFGAGVGELIASISSAAAGNTGRSDSLGTSYVFLILRYLVDVLPYALDVAVVFAGLALLREMAADRYSEGTVGASRRLSKLCGVALSVSVLSCAGFNLLQLPFVGILVDISANVHLPLDSIAFVLAVLLLSRFTAENKALKDDNDSII